MLLQRKTKRPRFFQSHHLDPEPVLVKWSSLYHPDGARWRQMAFPRTQRSPRLTDEHVEHSRTHRCPLEAAAVACEKNGAFLLGSVFTFENDALPRQARGKDQEHLKQKRREFLVAPRALSRGWTTRPWLTAPVAWKQASKTDPCKTKQNKTKQKHTKTKSKSLSLLVQSSC
jgi:hypothetical protein